MAATDVSLASRDALARIALEAHDRLQHEKHPEVRERIRANVEFRGTKSVDRKRIEAEARAAKAVQKRWERHLANPKKVPKPPILGDKRKLDDSYLSAMPLATEGGYTLPCYYLLLAAIHDGFIDDVRDATGERVELIIPEAVAGGRPRESDTPLSTTARIYFGIVLRDVAERCLCTERMAREALQAVLADLVMAGLAQADDGNGANERDVVGTVEQPPAAQREAAHPKRRKRSTEPGETRAKIVFELTTHHQYETDSCLNWEPIKANCLARELNLGSATVSRFFKEQFGGYKQYCAACASKTLLIHAMQILNDELTPKILFQPLSGDVAAPD